MRCRNGQSGFSMVASLVAMGIVGGLAVALAELTRQQQEVQKNTETYFEINSLFNLMARTLYDGEACNETLIVGQPVSDARTINQVKNKDGGVVVQIGNKYGNRLLEVVSMTLDNTRINGTSGEVELVVELRKLSRAVKGYDRVTRRLSLSVEVASGGINLIKCRHATDHIRAIVRDTVIDRSKALADTKVEEARRKLCVDLGGIYSSAFQKCSYAGQPVLPASLPAVPIRTRIAPSISHPTSPRECERPEYICRGDSNVMYSTECILKGQGSTYPTFQRNTTYACYLKSDSHPVKRATSNESCEHAKILARAVVDPTDLVSTPSTREPAAGNLGRIDCDTNCYLTNVNTYTARCAFRPRGWTWECNYMCTTPP